MEIKRGDTFAFEAVATQIDSAVYALLPGDPAAFTEFVPDFPNLEIDLPGAGSTTVPRLLKWVWWAEASHDGIELMFGAVRSDDGINVVIDVDAVDARLHNPNFGTVVQISGGVVSRSDGSPWVAADASSGVIEPLFGKAYVAPGAAAVVVPEGERVVTVRPDGRYLARG